MQEKGSGKMDFRQRQKDRQTEFDKKHGIDDQLGRTLDQFVNLEYPQDGDSWGNWTFDAKALVLSHRSI